MCKKSIFKKLLYTLTTEYSTNGKIYKQKDGVSMGGHLSVVFSGYFMNKLETEILL